MTTFNLSCLVLIALLAILGFWLWRKGIGTRRESAAQLASLRQELSESEARLHGKQAELTRLQLSHAQASARLEAAHELKASYEQLIARFNQSQLELKKLEVALAALKSESSERSRAQDEKLKLMSDARQMMGEHFKILSEQVLEERTEQFENRQQGSLKGLLEPLRERLTEFSLQLAQHQSEHARRHGELSQEINALKGLGARMNEEALALTRALKGDLRTQGAWGELILDRILELSGLRQGEEYEKQAALKGSDGSRPRPDVLIRLPQGRALVVDAKVSLTAYERAENTSEREARASVMRQHVDSIKRHIQDLQARDYSAALEGRGLDFVMLFVPVESAYLEALRADPTLVEYALHRNVALTAPSTLLATMRAVAHIWKLEQRNQNAEEIADRAGKLYDKFSGFVGDLKMVEDAMRKSTRAMEEAMAKLAQGPGNLLRQVEMLKELGARTVKSLPKP